MYGQPLNLAALELEKSYLVIGARAFKRLFSGERFHVVLDSLEHLLLEHLGIHFLEAFGGCLLASLGRELLILILTTLLNSLGIVVVVCAVSN